MSHLFLLLPPKIDGCFVFWAIIVTINKNQNKFESFYNDESIVGVLFEGQLVSQTFRSCFFGQTMIIIILDHIKRVPL